MAIEKDTADAVQETEEDIGTYTHVFKKPVTYNGKTYDKLSFDFDALTGADGLNIENELQSIGRPALVPAFSGEYLSRMAAKACTETVGADIFGLMSIRDYNKIRSVARSFLLKSE